MLQSHVRLGGQSNTSAEDVGHSCALLSKRVDDGGSRRGQRGLQHVAENAEDAVESLVVLGGSTAGGMGFPADASHELCHKTEINNEWTGQKRVFTDVRHA